MMGWLMNAEQQLRRKPAPVPLFPPQIPHDLNWDQTQTTAMGMEVVLLKHQNKK
jgi:hypothetical protein